MATQEDTRLRLEGAALAFQPRLDLTPGSALSELLIKPLTELFSEEYTVVESLGLSSAVQTALANPTGVTPQMDQVASNFFITRKPAEFATGLVRLTIPASITSGFIPTTATVVSQSGDQFTLAAGTFGPSAQRYTYQTNVSDSATFIIVPCTSTTTNETAQLPTGAALTVTGLSFDVTAATAYSTFTRATPVETDGELVTRIQRESSVRNYTTTAGTLVSLRDKFPDILDATVLGLGDPELVRAKSNSFGVTVPGFTDVVVRTARSTYVHTAVLQGTRSANGWTINVPADVAPGFCSVKSVKLVNDSNLVGTLKVLSVDFNFDTTTTARRNALRTARDGRFTSYQTATITVEPTSSSPIMAAQSFECQFIVQPGIANIQSYLLDDATRGIGQDVLVRAMIPCFVSMNLQVHRKRATDTFASLNLAKLQVDIYRYINNLPLGSSLSVSQIIRLCHAYDISHVTLPLNIEGVIPSTTGGMIKVSSSSELEIPTVASDGLSPRTCGFVTDLGTSGLYAGIGVSLV